MTALLLLGLGEVGTLWMIRRRGEGPRAGQARLAERIWVGAPLALLVAMGLAAIFAPGTARQVRGDPKASGARLVVGRTLSASALTIEVSARQFRWDFHYPGAGLESQAELHVPSGQDVALRLESRDVVHSFDIPSLGIRQDVLPGKPVLVSLRVAALGRYEIVCSSLCGSSSDQEMTAALVVEDQPSFARWITRMRSGNTKPIP